MTPDERRRLGAWMKERWPFFVPFGFSSVVWIEVMCAYFIPGPRQHALGLLIVALVAFWLVPVLTVIIKLNGRVARYRMRKQDSITRLTKRHEKMLREIRRLEREVTERTEDLPPETIPVSMRDYTDKTFDY